MTPALGGKLLVGAISAKAEDDDRRGSGGLTFVAKLRARPQILSIKRMRAARAEHAVFRS
eukprot:scaffold67207_cov84-Phaeocystis_antarctica.AAC.1